MPEETTFTRIVDGKLPSYAVYEDETTYAFLDANPVAPGHTLVIPKEPFERLQDLPPEIATDLYETVHDLIPAIEVAVGAGGTSIVLSNGEAAGQEIPHVHWHIVPRSEDDGSLVEFHSLLDGELGDAEMASLAADIRAGRE